MIRVLALNDDNHATYFTREDGVRYYDAADFINNCLAKPHAIEYVVRGFYICDDFSHTPLRDVDETVIDEMFDCVESGGELYGRNFTESFDTLWAASSERWS